MCEWKEEVEQGIKWKRNRRRYAVYYRYLRTGTFTHALRDKNYKLFAICDMANEKQMVFNNKSTTLIANECLKKNTTFQKLYAAREEKRINANIHTHARVLLLESPHSYRLAFI